MGYESSSIDSGSQCATTKRKKDDSVSSRAQIVAQIAGILHSNHINKSNVEPMTSKSVEGSPQASTSKENLNEMVEQSPRQDEDLNSPSSDEGNLSNNSDKQENFHQIDVSAETENISTIIKLLKAIMKMQAEIHTENSKILKKLNKIKNTTEKAATIDLKLKLPLRKIKRLEQLEIDLSNNEYKDSFINKIKSYGGCTGQDFLINVARNLFDDKLLSKYSFCGKKGKKPFRNFVYFLDSLLDAANLTAHYEITVNDIAEFFKVYLKNAPFRMKRSK